MSALSDKDVIGLLIVCLSDMGEATKQPTQFYRNLMTIAASVGVDAGRLVELGLGKDKSDPLL